MATREVSCPSCGRPNPAGKRFCGDCGAPLPLNCPNCGEENPPGKRFCGDCGAALAGVPAANADPGGADAAEAGATSLIALRAPAADERRLVTALFCDLVGFTPIAERLDPEEVREIQAGYFAAMRERIERYGGTIEKYAGDAVLALFGTPVAHEDDAERAVLCGLGMHEAMAEVTAGVLQRHEVELKIRVGVNTGEVVSGNWDISGVAHLDISGDAVNTAARLEAAAEPGEVLVGLETMQLTRRRILYGERRLLALKGKSTPAPSYPALRIREEIGERWEAQRTPLVGRERELMQLTDAWARVQRGEGQMLTLVGEPGVGKSRLIGEATAAPAEAGAVTVRGRCLSYGQQISLWLITDVLRSVLGIREDATTEEMRTRLDAEISALLAGYDESTRNTARDVLGSVFGLPATDAAPAGANAEVRRRLTIRSLRCLLLALSARAPTVLILEDVHWIDMASAEVMTELLADVPGLRLLVLVAQRPGWTAPWAAWEWPESIHLRALRGEDCARLARAVLRNRPLSRELERYVTERSSGNPYFVEELLRALQDSGAAVERNGRVDLVAKEEHLPATLTEVLLARLDQLESDVRSLAQVASVIGRNFAVRLLATVLKEDEVELEPRLTSLQRAEIAFPRLTPDLEYIFKHAAMREVAYNTLLKKQRRQIHEIIAKAIAALYPADEFIEMIAYHFARTDANEDAAQWLERAGDRAAEVYANELAVKHYEDARERLQRLDAAASTLARVDEKLGGVLTTLGQYDRALTALQRAADAHQASGERGSLGRVVAQMGQVHYQRGSSADGIAMVREFLAAETSADSAATGASVGAAVYAALTLLYFATGQYEEQLAAAQEAARLAETAEDQSLLASTEVSRALALLALGHRKEAQGVLEGVLPLAEANGDLTILSGALDNLSNVHYFRGEFAQSRAYLERGLAVAEQMGNPAAIGHMLFMLGTNALWAGDWPRSRAYFDRDRAVVGSLDRARTAALPLYGLGQLATWEGDWEEATTYLEEARQLAEASGNLPILKWVHRMLAERELDENDAAAVVARLTPLLNRPGLQGSATLLAPLAEAYAGLGNAEAAAASVSSALSRATAEEDAIDLAYALRALERSAIRQEKWDEASAALTRGLALARRMRCPSLEAEYLHDQGVMLTMRGAVDEARLRYTDALTLFRKLGAARHVSRTERALRELETESSQPVV